MARVRVMYWYEVPVQVQAHDENGAVSRPLDRRFQEAADAIAMFDGSAGTDAYLAGWDWGPFTEAPGTANDLASATAARYNVEFPGDIAAVIRDLQRAGRRDRKPGALDHLMAQRAT